MRAGWAAIVLLFIAPASCGSPDPAPVEHGSALQGSLAGEWPAGAPAREVRFSRDGRLLATSDASGQISLRDTRSWRAVGQLHHEGGATSIAFSPDGTALYSAGYDGSVRIWDVRSARQTGALPAVQGTIWTIDVSPDGSQLAAGGEDAAIHVWTLARPDAPMTLRGHDRNVWEVRFSPDGKFLASGSFDASTRLWEAATGRPMTTLTGHEQAVVGLAFSPDGTVLATCGDDSTIRLWRMSGGTPLRTIRTGNHTYKLAFSKDGRWLASGGRARDGLGTFWHQLTGGGRTAKPIRIWRTSDAALVGALASDDDIAHLDISPDGQWLVTSGEDRRFRLWKLRTVER